ncbi:MAG: ribonuclease P protein component, partial [Calditrichota bacterium]
MYSNAEEKRGESGLPLNRQPEDNRLPKSLVITKQRCFQNLFKHGRRISGDIGQVIVLPCESTKVAFVVGKKVGSAVTRNSLRRYLREFVRTHKYLIPKNNAVIF